MQLKPYLTLPTLLFLLYSFIPRTIAAVIPPTALLHPSNLQRQVQSHLDLHHSQHAPPLSLDSPHEAPHCLPSPCLTAFLSNEAAARNLCDAFTITFALPKRLPWIVLCLDTEKRSDGIIETLTGACACLNSGDDGDYVTARQQDL